jgi:hypothetical protein
MCAEGFDLKVIQGASDLIGKTEVFLLEAGSPAPSKIPWPVPSQPWKRWATA